MKLKLFEKKETKHVPVAEVEGMLRTGTPEAVIRSRLKEEKYATEDINKAIEQAKIKVGATGIPNSMKPPWEQADSGSMPPREGAPPELTPVPSFPPPAGSKPPAPAKTSQIDESGAAPFGAGMPQAGSPQSMASQSGNAQFGTPQVGKYSIGDLETVIKPLIEGLKLEVDSKFDSISKDLQKVTETEKKLEKVVTELESIKTKLSKASAGAGGGNYDEELAQLKGSVNTILEILKGTLPPVIKSLRELKEEKATTKTSKKQVEHLI